jgi:hypothetical protein
MDFNHSVINFNSSKNKLYVRLLAKLNVFIFTSTNFPHHNWLIFDSWVNNCEFNLQHFRDRQTRVVRRKSIKCQTTINLGEVTLDTELNGKTLNVCSRTLYGWKTSSKWCLSCMQEMINKLFMPEQHSAGDQLDSINRPLWSSQA